MNTNQKTVLLTGGAGFIGSHMSEILNEKSYNVVVVDSLTYAGDINNILHLTKNNNFLFCKGDIGDSELIGNLLVKFNVDIVLNFAAESHVDNSINSSKRFVVTNVLGTHELLNSCLNYLEQTRKTNFRFIQISTDEVFGEVGDDGIKFSESSAYNPRSPYSASKASADHLVNAWVQTYNFPAIITHCSNNFGPRQHSEKFIPTIIRKALLGQEIPIYGDGKNIRDWLYVVDHCIGVLNAAENGIVGQNYCFGGGKEIENVKLASMICNFLDEIAPKPCGEKYKTQLEFVKDRKGHDRHYAVDYTKAAKELNFTPSKEFEKKLFETVKSFVN